MKVPPEVVRASEMRRHWWVSYIWLNTTTQADPEPIYARSGLRPIEEAVEAAAQFDEFHKNYQANNA